MSEALGQHVALQTTPLGQFAAPTRPPPASPATRLPPRARRSWRREGRAARKRARASKRVGSTRTSKGSGRARRRHDDDRIREHNRNLHPRDGYGKPIRTAAATSGPYGVPKSDSTL